MKTLAQIQLENRKMILKAIHQANYEEALKPLTLDKVLLAIMDKGYYDDIYFNEESKTLELDIDSLSWNLTKSTLEEQDEKMQRAIHKFLNEDVNF